MSYDGRITIYIKQADRAKWDAIKDKPEWLHDKLNPIINIKVNKDGTISPEDSTKPTRYTT